MINLYNMKGSLQNRNYIYKDICAKQNSVDSFLFFFRVKNATTKKTLKKRVQKIVKKIKKKKKEC